MPATVCPSSPTKSQTGAESTFCPSIRNKKCWFLDIDIDRYLTFKITCDGFSYLNPCVVLLLAESNYPLFDLPNHVISSHTVFCPLNIDNLHWILFVFDKNNHSFYIDPIKLGFDTKKSTLLCSSLNDALNRIFKSKIILGQNPYISYLDQKNSYDCGPFVCLYADRIQRGDDLIKPYEVDNIREITFNLSNPDYKPIYRGYGPGVTRIDFEINISLLLEKYFCPSSSADIRSVSVEKRAVMAHT